MSNMQFVELLAPAKNLECGIAAIDHGADAVYIGAQRFGARAAAGNSEEDIVKLCNYAHQYGAKVYVTVNTLLHDDELDVAQQMIGRLNVAGADAFLIQDLRLIEGLTYLSSDSHPPVFHASTQTDNRTIEKVQRLRSLGFRRVVLARELSSSEIASIHEAVPDVELEVFVHGALCVSYSGICYASEHCFGRSANRGECAQFCRLKFNLLDADNNVIEHGRHLLSLKDMCRIDYLEELLEAGAVSLKIEGRLKNPDYVKNVVAAYSQRLNDIIRKNPGKYRRSSLGLCTYSFTPSLSKTFNRGYTNYFLHGRSRPLASFYTPKAIGENVGVVKKIERRGANGETVVVVAGTSSFANGDGLCFFDSDRELIGFRVNRVEGNKLFLLRFPEGLTIGKSLYRNHDEAFEKLLSGRTSERKIPICIIFSAVDGGFQLCANILEREHNTGNEVCLTLNIEHQAAQKDQKENIVRQLSKLGNTPFCCDEVMFKGNADKYFIPSSLLSELKRNMVDGLLKRVGSSDNSDYSDCSDNSDYSDCSENSDYSDNSDYSESKQPLMQCRYCLRYEMGFCIRKGGKQPRWREPLRIEMTDGRQFRLEFNCRDCQMNVCEL